MKITADQAMADAGIDYKVVRDCLRAHGYTIVKIRCPFTKGDFSIPVNEPCPVCGMTGELDAPDYCIG